MRNYTKHLKKYLHHYLISLILIVSLFAIFYSLTSKESAHLYTVSSRDLVSTITFAGSVVPADDVDLAFETSGRVKFAPYKKGDYVKKGNILASLDDSKLLAQLEQTKANIKEVKSNLEELKSPAKKEEILLQESKITSYKVDILNTKEKLIDAHRASYITADNVIRGYIDQMFEGPKTSPRLVFDASDNNKAIDLEKNRIKIEDILIDWKIKTIYSNKKNVTSYLKEAKENLNEISLFLSEIATEVNKLEPSSSLSSEKINLWKTSLISGRNAIEKSISSITILNSNINELNSKLEIEKRDLDLIKSPAKEEGVKAYEAKISSLEALLKNYESNISGLKIVSPINGIISKYDLNEGQSVPAYKSLVSVISDLPLQVEANLSELDIPYIKVGDQTEIRFDAYGDSVLFAGIIKSIDETETLINNLPTYTVKIEILNQDKKILSGMSAEVKSIVWQKEGVISIPISSIKTQGNDMYVLKLNTDNLYQKTKVKVSKVADGGYAEVIGGLSLGDLIKLKYND